MSVWYINFCQHQCLCSIILVLNTKLVFDPKSQITMHSNEKQPLREQDKHTCTLTCSSIAATSDVNMVVTNHQDVCWRYPPVVTDMQHRRWVRLLRRELSSNNLKKHYGVYQVFSHYNNKIFVTGRNSLNQDKIIYTALLPYSR